MKAAEERWEKQWRPTICGRDSEAWDTVWGELTDGFPEVNVPAGTVLYEQGDPADEVIFLHHGTVWVESCHKNGKKRVIYALFNGLTVGEEECMFGGDREFRAVCNTECRISRIPAEEFRRRVEGSHALAVKLLQASARKGQVLCNLLTRDSFLDVEERIARFLVSQAEYYGEPENGGMRLTVRITQQELADFLGISRVAVSQSLSELREKGILDKRGRYLLIRDVPALQELSAGRL